MRLRGRGRTEGSAGGGGCSAPEEARAAALRRHGRSAEEAGAGGDDVTTGGCGARSRAPEGAARGRREQCSAVRRTSGATRGPDGGGGDGDGRRLFGLSRRQGGGVGGWRRTPSPPGYIEEAV